MDEEVPMGVKMGYSKHYRDHHYSNEFTRDNPRFNVIESFWAFTKLRLNKLIIISKKTF